MTAGRRPFDVRVEAGGVLVLTLDTPGGSINVLGLDAATQLQEVLSGLPGSGVTALVIRSAKPGSFINGVGLLHASSLDTEAAAVARSAPVRATIQALADAPVPTVAVIEGNCFGCGLEIALACRGRIARDTFDTQFAMTELRDYRFIPLFGGTHRLPKLLGVPSAAALLLEGEQWDVATAHARGLVDVRLPARATEAEVRRQVAALIARRREPGPRDGAQVPPPRRGARTHALSAAVPPPRRELWRTCAALLTSAHTPGEAERELAAYARTITSASAKRAMGFFFIRHMARAATFRTADRQLPTVRLRCARDPALHTLSALLESRALRFSPPRALTLGGRGRAAIPVVLGLHRRAVPTSRSSDDRPTLYLPGGLSAPLLAEVAGGAPEQARALAVALEWAGFEVVRSTPAAGGDFVINRLIRRYLIALSHSPTGSKVPGARVARTAWTPGGVARALWQAGVASTPAERLRAWGGPTAVDALLGPDEKLPTLRQLAKPCDPSAHRPLRGAFERLCEALTTEAAACLADRSLAHPSQADVLVRHLFDFPLEEGSLLQRADRVGHLPTPEAGRGFYAVPAAKPTSRIRQSRGREGSK